ncbi:hypothetical protein TNCV_3746951 [Trichonephila clavipes]|nr:hypothetical protein TNCV_3746951 [Trichonephila clavipes]
MIVYGIRPRPRHGQRSSHNDTLGPSKPVLAHVFFWRSLSRNVGEWIPGNPSPPTSSGSNTIRSWSPTSSTDAGTTFVTRVANAAVMRMSRELEEAPTVTEALDLPQLVHALSRPCT